MDQLGLHRSPDGTLMLSSWPGVQSYGVCADEWNLGSADPREKPLSLLSFIKCEQSAGHLALIRIEIVALGLCSGLA